MANYVILSKYSNEVAKRRPNEWLKHSNGGRPAGHSQTAFAFFKPKENW